MKTPIRTDPFRHLLLFCLVAGCTGERLERPGPQAHALMEQEGIFHPGEHAFFKSSQGEVFSLILEGKEAQETFRRSVPGSEERDICLFMRFSGEISSEKGELRERVLAVHRILEVHRTACPPSEVALPRGGSTPR